MLKFEEHEVTKIIGYLCNDMGFITYEEGGFLHSEYPTVWGWSSAAYLISDNMLYLSCEEPNFYAQVREREDCNL